MKTHITYLAIIFGLAMLLLFTCNREKPCKPRKSSGKPVLISSDTAKTPVKDSSGWHRPKSTNKTGNASISAQLPDALTTSSVFWDTVYVIGPGQVVDTAAILADYNTVHHFSDTNRFEEAEVIVQNSTIQNRIAAQRVLLNYTNKTITNTYQVEDHRTQLYFGIEAQGNQYNPVSGLGASLMLKTRGNMCFEAGVMYMPLDTLGFTRQAVQYKAGIKRLISFRK